MKTTMRTLMLAAAALLPACVQPHREASPTSPLFEKPQRVSLEGYDGHAMEPFITRDGRYLLFNNLNHPSVNTDLHYAERIDDLHFRYRGELTGANTSALDGVPTMDRRNVLYFVSTRSYEKTLSTIYRGNFADGRVSQVELVPGLSKQVPGIVNFDVDVSPDGETLYFVEGRFVGSAPQTADILIAARQGAGFRRLDDGEQIMKHVNTAALEYAPCIAADGLTLFFTRLGTRFDSTPGLYMATRAGTAEAFGPPYRLAAEDGFVEAPALSPDGQSLYYHKREGTKFVIYRMSRR